MRQIVLDTETTGLKCEEGHRIIEIGCIELINRKLTGRTYHQYINPERDIDEGALAVHGLTRPFLETKPTFSAIVDELMSFIQDAELIIHNAPFDVGFINAELVRLQKHWRPVTDYCRIFDTLALARQLHTGQRNNLDALCKRYQVDHSHRDLHGALLDAQLLAEVYLAMTGGQSNLFDELQGPSQDAGPQKSTAMAQVAQHNLLVLHADAEELAAHEMALKKIAEKGKCLWNELE